MYIFLQYRATVNPIKSISQGFNLCPPVTNYMYIKCLYEVI